MAANHRMPTNPRFKDMTGSVHNRLTVVGFAGVSSKHHAMWVCVCECGSNTTVAGHALRSGSVKSCGCLRDEYGKKRATHGATVNGMLTPEYTVWKGILSRCRDKSNHLYGGRGIGICERWEKSFSAFLADMGPRPEGTSIERKDNDGNYEPGNCIWATNETQNRNKRQTKLFTVGGTTLCLKDWATKHGIKVTTLWYRIKSGMNIEDALLKGPSGRVSYQR